MLNFLQSGPGTNLFDHANLRSKFFRNFLITECSGLLIFQRGCQGTNFFWSC